MALPDPASVFDDWALLLLQCLSLVVIVVYVWKTWEMASATRASAESSAATLREAKEARLDALAPRVLVYSDPSSSSVAEVVVLNDAGAGTALDVRLDVTPRIPTSNEYRDPGRFFDTPKAAILPATPCATSSGHGPL